MEEKRRDDDGQNCDSKEEEETTGRIREAGKMGQWIARLWRSTK